ncbi:hypothetical protein [Sphingobacterium hungaricum]|uniref:Uncharacterized protein n=1 Tax=Sphingobacterium hungaricum TaxID=2082723 RepID=A0A928UXY3_9SPHI|nr:hypothetical protein [Sphingobacterium hungaricum]MBE8715291.1 hypothetical protein [Sphingobacterium hungaricum]
MLVDGECLLDAFYREVLESGNLKKDFVGAISILKSSANGLLLPKTKFRIIEHKRLPYKLYEAKKDDIRIYCFHEEKTGRIIVAGGKKSTQKRDIHSIVNLLIEYYNGK